MAQNFRNNLQRNVGTSDVTLITGNIDEKLNESWYIVPGLGDMGDRLFGTT